MAVDEIIKRRIKRLKRVHPELDEGQLERELIPLSGDNIGIKTLRKKKR